MRKLLLSTTLFLMGVCWCSARTLVLEFVDGDKAYYHITNNGKPVMTFKDHQVIIDGDGFEMGKVERFYIDAADITNGIGMLSWERQGAITIYGLDGKQIELTESADGKYVSLDTLNLTPGVYIIKSGNKTSKFIKN